MSKKESSTWLASFLQFSQAVQSHHLRVIGELLLMHDDGLAHISKPQFDPLWPCGSLTKQRRCTTDPLQWPCGSLKKTRRCTTSGVSSGFPSNPIGKATLSPDTLLEASQWKCTKQSSRRKAVFRRLSVLRCFFFFCFKEARQEKPSRCFEDEQSKDEAKTEEKRSLRGTKDNLSASKPAAREHGRHSSGSMAMDSRAPFRRTG